MPGQADVIDSDTTIRDALCVGAGCLNTEGFGSDELKLKASTISIHLDDTSDPTGPFASNDWRIAANAAVSGGASFFAVEDVTAARTPFLIEAGARGSALVVDAGGGVGLGTADPLMDLHILNGDSPAVRLDQDGSGGLLPQVWDVVGNETSFFLRDVTSGSTLPFRVRSGSATDTLTVSPNGVGINVPSAATTLEISDPDETLVVIRDSVNRGPQQLLRIENFGMPMVFLTNVKNDKSWLMAAGGSLTFSPSEDPSAHVFKLSPTGNLTIAGALTQASDRTRKTAIEPVDGDAILAKVAGLPVAEWTYLHDAAQGTRHIGPMAQDFHAAFGLGADETGIASLDGNGVALAAIQALLARVEVLEARLAAR